MTARRSTEVIEGWGAFWIDGLSCDQCGRSWAEVDTPVDGPDARQYLTVRLGNVEFTICPQCGDELHDQLAVELAADVPMAPGPEDTETTCVLPDDYYIQRLEFDNIWYDEETHTMRYADTNRPVPISRDQYRKARRELQRRNGDWSLPGPERMRLSAPYREREDARP